MSDDKKIMKTLNGYTVYDEDAHRRIDSLAGSAPGLVFDTVADMEAYVAEHSAELKVGQNLYIREVDVPDYWWDGTAVQELEAEVDLSGYAKQEEVDRLSKAIADHGVWYGTCSATTGVLAVTTTTQDFVLTVGSRVGVLFRADVVNSVVLNVDGTGDYPIASNVYDDGTADIGANITYKNKGQIIWFTFSGAYWLADDSVMAGEDTIGKVSLGQIRSIAQATANGKANASGWTANKYIGTDADGNMVAVEAPDGSGTVVTAVEPADDDIPCIYFSTGGKGMPFTKDEGDVQVVMQYDSETKSTEWFVTAKVQGSSSASNATYKKRNWTIKVYTDSTYEDKQKVAFKGWSSMNKFVLKAGWVIPGHLRNVGAAKIWGQIMRSRPDYDTLPEELRNSANQGATDGFHVRVFIDGQYWGIYDFIVAKDQIFGQDRDNPKHSILNSELNNQPTCAFATTTPTISGNWSEELQDSMTAETKTSMENWIKFVAGSTDEEFVANAENYFDVQSVIDAICFDRIIMTVDNMCRNQIVFKYDTKWFMGKWDLDAILGLPPVAGQSWYSYDTPYQEGYVAYKDYGIINMLYKRTEELFLDRFKARYWELRSGALSENNIVRVFGKLSDRLRSIDGLMAEENASTTGNGQFTGMPNVANDTIQQIREFVTKRCAYMDEVVENMTNTGGGETEPDEETVPCTGITLSADTLTFATTDTQTLTATVTPDDCTDTVIWESDNTNVATVVNGVVTPIANGNAIITATCGEYSDDCAVNVTAYTVADPMDVVESFADSAWVEGYYDDDGVESSFQSMHRSQLIPVTEDSITTVTIPDGIQFFRIAYFNADKSFATYDRGHGLGKAGSDVYSITLNQYGGTYYAICANTTTKTGITVTSTTDAFSTSADPISQYIGSNRGDITGEWNENNGGASATLTGGTWDGNVLKLDGVDDVMTLPLTGAKSVLMKARIASDYRVTNKPAYAFDCRSTVSAYLINYNKADYIGTGATVYVRGSALPVNDTTGFASNVIPGVWLYFVVVFNNAFTGNMKIGASYKSVDFMQMDIAEISVFDTDVTSVSQQ